MDHYELSKLSDDDSDLASECIDEILVNLDLDNLESDEELPNEAEEVSEITRKESDLDQGDNSLYLYECILALDNMDHNAKCELPLAICLLVLVDLVLE